MRKTNPSESLDSIHLQRQFIVIVHDVCKAHADDIHRIVAALEPFVGRTIAAAVVPNWHGVRIDEEVCFTEWVTRQFGEILLHGWTHSRDARNGLVSFFTNRSDEFAGLTQDETNMRLQLGQSLLTEIFGPRVAGFVPPAWQRGRIRRETLVRHGLEFLFGYLSIELVDGRRIPVSTITWDVGRFGLLGYAAEMFGRVLCWGRSRSIPCLAVHPVDVARGFLPRIIRTVESWMQSGRTPVLPGKLFRLTSKCLEP